MHRTQVQVMQMKGLGRLGYFRGLGFATDPTTLLPKPTGTRFDPIGGQEFQPYAADYQAQLTQATTLKANLDQLTTLDAQYIQAQNAWTKLVADMGAAADRISANFEWDIGGIARSGGHETALRAAYGDYVLALHRYVALAQQLWDAYNADQQAQIDAANKLPANTGTPPAAPTSKKFFSAPSALFHAPAPPKGVQQFTDAWNNRVAARPTVATTPTVHEIVGPGASSSGGSGDTPETGGPESLTQGSDTDWARWAMIGGLGLVAVAGVAVVIGRRSGQLRGYTPRKRRRRR